MKSIVKQVFMAGFILLAAIPVASARQRKVVTMNAAEVVLINELGAVVRLTNDTLTVEMIDPPERRAETYKGVDLREGDHILMCNGRRVAGIEGFRTILDSLAVGETVKLGLTRDGRLTIASFPKAEMSDAKAGTMVIKQSIGPDGESEQSTWTGSGTFMVLDGGILLTGGDDGPVVASVLPLAEKRITGDMPREGDRILSVNGEFDTDIEEFRKLYDKIPDGETITVMFEREGAKHKATYVKAPIKTDGPMIINK